METQEWMNDSFTHILQFKRSFTTAASKQGALLGARGQWGNIDQLPAASPEEPAEYSVLQSLDSGARLPRFSVQLCHLPAE